MSIPLEKNSYVYFVLFDIDYFAGGESSWAMGEDYFEGGETSGTMGGDNIGANCKSFGELEVLKLFNSHF